ncbi:MAG: hypothetical protein Q8O98_01175 [bacterium]|nr:hypothetical protein [bacterium]
MNEIEQQIQAVALARWKAAGLQFQKDELFQEWRKANQKLLDTLTQAGEDVAVKEAWLRTLTLSSYLLTGNKTPAPGVSVKVFQVLDYDKELAYLWAMTHQVALKLDTPTFEKLAKASPIDCVQIVDEPRAQIAQDLSAVLKESGND